MKREREKKKERKEKLANKNQTNLVFQNKRSDACDAKNGYLGKEWADVILLDLILFSLSTWTASYEITSFVIYTCIEFFVV